MVIAPKNLIVTKKLDHKFLVTKIQIELFKIFNHCLNFFSIITKKKVVV